MLCFEPMVRNFIFPFRPWLILEVDRHDVVHINRLWHPISYVLRFPL
jgi:hypothetical protein